VLVEQDAGQSVRRDEALEPAVLVDDGKPGLGAATRQPRGALLVGPGRDDRWVGVHDRGDEGVARS
jgi:hypothetical protein